MIGSEIYLEQYLDIMEEEKPEIKPVKEMSVGELKEFLESIPF